MSALKSSLYEKINIECTLSVTKMMPQYFMLFNKKKQFYQYNTVEKR